MFEFSRQNCAELSQFVLPLCVTVSFSFSPAFVQFLFDVSGLSSRTVSVSSSIH